VLSWGDYIGANEEGNRVPHGPRGQSHVRVSIKQQMKFQGGSAY
jgi:hypothetical protein